MKVKVKRIVAVIMLVLLIINSLPMSAFAAFITDINSNAEFGVVSGSLGEYNHELHYATGWLETIRRVQRQKGA